MRIGRADPSRSFSRVTARRFFANSVRNSSTHRCSVGETNIKKKEDARLVVLREYDRWAKDHPNDAKKMGGFVFFGYLEKERPDLLDFRAVGSKWQTVHGWLRHGGRLED
jgi:hypothetical protein